MQKWTAATTPSKPVDAAFVREVATAPVLTPEQIDRLNKSTPPTPAAPPRKRGRPSKIAASAAAPTPTAVPPAPKPRVRRLTKKVTFAPPTTDAKKAELKALFDTFVADARKLVE